MQITYNNNIELLQYMLLHLWPVTTTTFNPIGFAKPFKELTSHLAREETTTYGKQVNLIMTKP